MPIFIKLKAPNGRNVYVAPSSVQRVMQYTASTPVAPVCVVELQSGAQQTVLGDEDDVAALIEAGGR